MGGMERGERREGGSSACQTMCIWGAGGRREGGEGGEGGSAPTTAKHPRSVVLVPKLTISHPVPAGGGVWGTVWACLQTAILTRPALFASKNVFVSPHANQDLNVPPPCPSGGGVWGALCARHRTARPRRLPYRSAATAAGHVGRVRRGGTAVRLGGAGAAGGYGGGCRQLRSVGSGGGGWGGWGGGGGAVCAVLLGGCLGRQLR